MLNRLQEWLEGIASPGDDVEVIFSLTYRDLEVGQLSVTGGEWEFQYSEDFRAQDEIKPLTDFPFKDRVYKSTDLWPFFSIRVPSLQQPRVIDFMKRRNFGRSRPSPAFEAFRSTQRIEPFRTGSASCLMGVMSGRPRSKLLNKKPDADRNLLGAETLKRDDLPCMRSKHAQKLQENWPLHAS